MNAIRADARAAGEKFYDDAVECDFCGTTKRYVSNAACVCCSIARGKYRYAALTDADRAAAAAKDAARYQARKANAPE